MSICSVGLSMRRHAFPASYCLRLSLVIAILERMYPFSFVCVNLRNRTREFCQRKCSLCQRHGASRRMTIESNPTDHGRDGRWKPPTMMFVVDGGASCAQRSQRNPLSSLPSTTVKYEALCSMPRLMAVAEHLPPNSRRRSVRHGRRVCQSRC